MYCDGKQGSSYDEQGVIITAVQCTNIEQDIKVQNDKFAVTEWNTVQSRHNINNKYVNE